MPIVASRMSSELIAGSFTSEAAYDLDPSTYALSDEECAPWISFMLRDMNPVGYVVVKPPPGHQQAATWLTPFEVFVTSGPANMFGAVKCGGVYDSQTSQPHFMVSCNGAESTPMCENTCSALFVNDTWCSDGGPQSSPAVCDFGTDCADCGPRHQQWVTVKHKNMDNCTSASFNQIDPKVRR
jgi:hypothetical protein